MRRPTAIRSVDAMIAPASDGRVSRPSATWTQAGRTCADASPLHKLAARVEVFATDHR